MNQLRKKIPNFIYVYDLFSCNDIENEGPCAYYKKGKKYYKNSFGLDRKILNRTLALAGSCRKLHIPITTFMIARDPYLVQFVDQFTRVNNGKAFYSSQIDIKQSGNRCNQ